MDGNVGLRFHRVYISSNSICALDIILAACDVEGNFLVIKVRINFLV